MVFVVDASVTMAWCFEEETTPYTESILDRLVDEAAMVPAIWPLEVANILVIGERRQRVTTAQVTRFVQQLGNLPITVDTQAIAGAWGPVLSLARTQGLSAYDAAYLELAMRQGFPLATNDARLSEAAARVGVPLLH